MNLFISSFRQEWKILVGLLCLLLGLEFGLRQVEDRLSLDIKHIKAIPAILGEYRVNQGKHILFLGNSLTREGVDLNTLRRVWATRDVPAAHFQAVYPDDTTILDWHYLSRYTIGAMNEPVHLDLVVVGFAFNQLDDNQRFHSDRLGGYYGGLAALDEAFRHDIQGIGDKVDFLLCCFSKVFANRERLKNRVLDGIIPGYRRTSNIINQSIRERSKQAANTDVTYERLNRFLKALKFHHTSVIFVAMPVVGGYELDQGLREAITAGDGMLLDLREIDALSNSDYADGYHLAPSGATKYTTRLAEMILKCPGLFKSPIIHQANEPMFGGK